ncbi:hypothetical protein LguiA_012903 [Lonicera macranthoides]
MSCLNFEHGERWLQEEIKRDSVRLTQLEIERRMQLNKAPKEKLKSQPRKVKFEDEWDSIVTNRRHGGEVGESRIRDNNMGSSKKKVSLFDDGFIRRFEKMFTKAYEQSKKRGSLEPSQSPNTAFGEPNQLKEEEKLAISNPPLENKAETDEIEAIEVTAEEGELWVECVVPSLREKEYEEVLLQIEELQVQAHEDQMKLQKVCILKVDEMEHVDFIGVIKYDSHPNHLLGSFSNELKMIELKHDLKLYEFRLSKKAKQQIGRCGLNQTMLSKDSRTNLLEEKGYDVIQPNPPFNSIQEYYEFLNEGLNTHGFKDRAWKFKIKKAGVGKLEEFKIMLFYVLKLVS